MNQKKSQIKKDTPQQLVKDIKNLGKQEIKKADTKKQIKQQPKSPGKKQLKTIQKKQQLKKQSPQPKSPLKKQQKLEQIKNVQSHSPNGIQSSIISQLNSQGQDLKKNKEQAQIFKKYLDSTGIAMAFQVIFAEILDKKIQQNKAFQYTALRLRQIGQDLSKIKNIKR